MYICFNTIDYEETFFMVFFFFIELSLRKNSRSTEKLRKEENNECDRRTRITNGHKYNVLVKTH